MENCNSQPALTLDSSRWMSTSSSLSSSRFTSVSSLPARQRSGAGMGRPGVLADKQACCVLAWPANG